ncbi:PREDICTED: mediator of RNA polymerase II transcription subunit 27 [Aptenodytes forsteri]|nr:PREDICTED: mediator of RNA polymerase II transcription subunit 27 [Aptenodytes forsteri]
MSGSPTASRGDRASSIHEDRNHCSATSHRGHRGAAVKTVLSNMGHRVKRTGGGIGNISSPYKIRLVLLSVMMAVSNFAVLCKHSPAVRGLPFPPASVSGSRPCGGGASGRGLPGLPRRDLGELERLSNLVGKPSENHPLHNSGLLSLDPVQDKTPLYSQLLQAYKWSNKLQYHAGLASGLLNQQSLKRSANQMGVSANCRPKAQPTTLVLPPQYVDDVINRIDRMFPEMSIQLSRPNGTSAMLLVTLGKVLKVIVVMRSLFIDRTIVKGYSENVYTEDGKLDIWSKSNYQVFQKVTDHATTALLHYQLPQMPDVVVRSFMTWLRSYIKLFQAPCQRCGKFLQDGLPPTWRDFRTLEAFHDTCRQ